VPGAIAWSFEILLERTDGDEWQYRRDRRITRGVDAIGTTTSDGVPYLRPEICLLYKAPRSDADGDRRNAADYRAAAPLLDLAARAWLRGALDIAYPDHPWRA
jgi:hypothetical protein